VVLVGDQDNATRTANSPGIADTSSATGVSPDKPDILRLFAEEVAITRETAETGRLRVAKVTRTRDHIIDELLARETVEVERVPIGRDVTAVPAVRDDGDTMVIPVVEERLVVERRLVLKEEIHVRRVRTSEHFRETVPLRYQEAEITRLPAQAGDTTGEAPAGAASPATRKEN
jgi:uncharacterized protein (TIGR02271 family)